MASCVIYDDMGVMIMTGIFPQDELVKYIVALNSLQADEGCECDCDVEVEFEWGDDVEYADDCDTELRLRALELANNPNVQTKKVLERAEAYYKFLMGEDSK